MSAVFLPRLEQELASRVRDSSTLRRKVEGDVCGYFLIEIKLLCLEMKLKVQG